MPDFSIKKGDTYPPFLAELTDSSGVAWQLASAQIRFSMRHVASGVVVIDHADATIVDPDQNSARYDWAPGDTDRLGAHFAEFEVTFPSGVIETFPDNGNVLILVTEQVDIDSLPSMQTGLDDLIGYIPDLTAAEATLAARQIIPRVEREAADYLKHALGVAERLEEGLPLYAIEDFVRLAHTPVVSVSEVKVDGTAWAPGSYTWERAGVRLLGPGAGISLFSSAASVGRIDVTYIGGLGGEPLEVVKGVICARSARLLAKFRDDALGTDQINAEAYVVRFLSEGWAEHEREQLDRAGRTRAVSAAQAVSWLTPSSGPEFWGQ